MATQRIFDAHGGVVSTVTYNDAEKTVTYAQWQDPTPYIEKNKKLRELPSYICGGDMRRVASVPVVILMDWLRKDGISVVHYMKNQRAYAKWLERKVYDPSNSAFLTAPHKRSIASPNLIIPH